MRPLSFAQLGEETVELRGVSGCSQWTMLRGRCQGSSNFSGRRALCFSEVHCPPLLFVASKERHWSRKSIARKTWRRVRDISPLGHIVRSEAPDIRTK